MAILYLNRSRFQRCPWRSSHQYVESWLRVAIYAPKTPRFSLGTTRQNFSNIDPHTSLSICNGIAPATDQKCIAIDASAPHAAHEDHKGALSTWWNYWLGLSIYKILALQDIQGDADFNEVTIPKELLPTYPQWAVIPANFLSLAM